jgi:hypothetical protein
MLQNLQHLLSQVSAIHKKYEGIARITGENFNIFKLLRVETEEVRTHSAMLAMLLNPKGMHEQGNIFIKLFLEHFEINFLDFDSVEVFVEHSTNFGRIDILIQDKLKHTITVENKIYADDQDNQLWRYHQYAQTQTNLENIKLFYLTLWGYEASEKSLKSKETDIENLQSNDYQCISYKSDIIQWLEKCQEKAYKLPLLRETIAQYINLVKRLTHQSTNKNMENEVSKFITSSTDNFMAYINLTQNLDFGEVVKIVLEKTITEVIVEKEWEFVCHKLSDNAKTFPLRFSTKVLKRKGLVIRFGFKEKKQNHFFFGFCYEEGAKHIAQTDADKLHQAFKKVFGESAYSEFLIENRQFLSHLYWAEYINWSNEVYEKIYSGKFAEEVKNIVEKMLAIVDEVFQD